MDRRTKYTQKVIKETFINLLEEKEITKRPATWPVFSRVDVQISV